jgi:PleD family two-component response regulator
MTCKSSYPRHVGEVKALVDVAEKAMKKGKAQGKDQVVLAE